MLLTQDDIGHEYKIWIPCDIESDKMDELVQQLVALTGGMTAPVSYTHLTLPTNREV